MHHLARRLQLLGDLHVLADDLLRFRLGASPLCPLVAVDR